MGSFQKYLNLSADDKDKLVTKSGLDLTSLNSFQIPRICGTKSGKLVIDSSNEGVSYLTGRGFLPIDGITVDPLTTNYDVFIESMKDFGFKINVQYILFIFNSTFTNKWSRKIS